MKKEKAINYSCCTEKPKKQKAQMKKVGGENMKKKKRKNKTKQNKSYWICGEDDYIKLCLYNNQAYHKLGLKVHKQSQYKTKKIWS